MSRKKERIFEYRKAIEEFLFVIEKSTEIISNKIQNKEANEQIIEIELRESAENFLCNYNCFFNYKNNTILNGLVKFDLGKRVDLIPLNIDGGEIPGVDYYSMRSRFSSYEFKVEKFDLENGYISIKENISLLHHFKNNEIIEELRHLAEKSIVDLRDKREYVVRLMNAIEILKNKCDFIYDHPLKIHPSIKYWLELILDNSEQLLNAIIGKKGLISSDRVRTFILNALIEAAGIKAVGENKEKFIAEILNADSTIVGQYFNDFKKERFGMVEKSKKSVEREKRIESEKSKEDEKNVKSKKKIEGNLFSRQMIEAKNVSGLLLNRMKSKNSDVDVLKGNQIVEKMISIISLVEQVDLKEDNK